MNRKRELTRDFIGDLNPFNLNGYPIPKQSYTRSLRLASDACATVAKRTQQVDYRKPILKGSWLSLSVKWKAMQVASDFTLDGGMIPRSARRTIDERLELRHPAASSTAMMEFRGRKHVVRLVNVSRSGAMVIFPHTPNIGERLLIQLLDQGLVSGQVMWVKDGRIGVSFAAPTE